MQHNERNLHIAMKSPHAKDPKKSVAKKKKTVCLRVTEDEMDEMVR